jgi:carbonic anhydrase/acetyltransferase-like protein (isoleucine patch superfamily)
MIQNIKADVIRSWPLDENGWHVDPATATKIKLGAWATIGAEAKIGAEATISDGATIGAWATISDGATIGAGAKIGADAKIGDRAKIGDWATIGDRAKIGDWATISDGATIGADAKIGDRATSADLNDQFKKILQQQFGDKFIAYKWVKPNRLSPNFDGGTPIQYLPDTIVEEPNTELSDCQCAPGLHVLRFGYRPEWIGLCNLNHDLIPLRVEVMTDDVVFAGLPGADFKLRVKKLKVLD